MTPHETLRGGEGDPIVPIDQEVIRQAAQWMARLWSDQATADDVAACGQWRNQRLEHELAWQRMQAMGQKFSSVPDLAGRHALKTAPEKLQLMRRKSLKILGLTLLVGTVGEFGRRSDTWRAASADLASSVGEIREVTLPDGTQLVLNTHSAVDIDYTADARRIVLRFGEIMVTSAPDKAAHYRPLSVVGRDGEVRALGTRFVVRQDESGSHVSVFDGAVEVRPRHANADGVSRVDAGHQADYADDAVGEVTTVDETAACWSQGLLFAEQMPLADFIAEIGRYRRGMLRCDPDVAGMKVSGVFPLRDTDRALSNLTLGLPLQIRYRTRYWVTVIPRTD